MAAETGLSKSTTGRIWKAFGLWPHQIDTFKLSNDPQFTYSSLLNQVERWFALLIDKQLRRGVHTSVYALEKDIRDWITNRNHDPKPFTWTKTADEILERLASYLHEFPAQDTRPAGVSVSPHRGRHQHMQLIASRVDQDYLPR